MELVNAVVEKSMQKSVPSVVRELGAPAKVPSRHRPRARDPRHQCSFENNSQAYPLSVVNPAGRVHYLLVDHASVHSRTGGQPRSP